MTNKTTPRITLTPCTSKALVAHGYDAASKTLALQFQPGEAPYLYVDVPAETAGGLIAAESKGKFVAMHIRGKFKHVPSPA